MILILTKGHHNRMTELLIRKMNTGNCNDPESRPCKNLIYEVCEALDQYNVRYCHWKSNANIHKTLEGDGDLDLLIHRQDIQMFNHILMSLGFKEAEVSNFRRIPGIRDYYGYDPSLPSLIHIHAHFQLTVGHDATKRIHLNIEDKYLASASKVEVIKVPSVEYEYIVFVVRMVLKHLTWDAYYRTESRLNRNERFELKWLKEHVSYAKVKEILASDFKMIGQDEFNRCVEILSKERIKFSDIKFGQRLENQLNVNSRMNRWISNWRKLAYRLNEAFMHRVLKKGPKKRLSCGGIFIAVVGGDGSGKTTLIDSLYPWLNEVFDTMRIHLGKPRWSWLTIVVRGVLKIFRLVTAQPFLEAPFQYTDDTSKIKFPGYPWAIRELCTARDRFLTYRKASRFSTNGGIVISDRFPIPGIHFMDGPQIERMYGDRQKNALIKWLMNREKKYYRYISRPDLMIVLKVDPEISTQRKKEEASEDVKARAIEIWTHQWDSYTTHVIDAGSSKEDVLHEVKSLVWSYL